MKNLPHDSWDELYTFAKDLADKQYSLQDIEVQLLAKTTNAELIAEIIQQLKKVQNAIHHKNGLTKIGFGCLFLIAGFLITCFNFHSNQSFTVVMYSTSIIGLIFIFRGLYEILG